MKAGTPSTFLLFIDAGIMSVMALVPPKTRLENKDVGRRRRPYEVLVRLFGSGDILGENVFHDTPRAADVTSMSTCYFYVLMKAQCEALMARHKSLDNTCVFQQTKSDTVSDSVQVGLSPQKDSWKQVRRMFFKPTTLHTGQTDSAYLDDDVPVVIYRRTAWVVEWVTECDTADFGVALYVTTVQAQVGGVVELDNGATFKNPKRSHVSPEFMRQQRIKTARRPSSPGKPTRNKEAGQVEDSHKRRRKDKVTLIKDK
jgi:hypothetical protein